MTLYWWSHWFWITLLSNCLTCMLFVQTYPSQEFSSEYNTNDSQNAKTTVTKLHQTSSTVLWAITLAPPSNHSDEHQAESQNREISAIPATQSIKLAESIELTVESEENRTKKTWNAEDNPEESPFSEQEEHDFKRSAEISIENRNQSANATLTLKPSEESKEQLQNTSTTVTMERHNTSSNWNGSETQTSLEVSKSNITNSNAGENNKQTTTALSSNATLMEHSNATININITTTTTPLAPITSTAAPSKPQIDYPPESTIEWLQRNGLRSKPKPKMEAAADEEQLQGRIPFTLENANKEEEIVRAENEHRTRKSKVLSAEYKHITRFFNYSTDPRSLLTRSASSLAPTEGGEEGNVSSEALSIQRTYFLDASAISAICFTIFGVCCTVATIGIVLYRRRFLNKPQALSEPDSSVYIDDSTLRDNSDEMYSLDNDSFLNSLEAMTIQNYWTDTVKHTKL